jgi:ATP-dependent Clp protease ATP-binding subunit ClpA
MEMQTPGLLTKTIREQPYGVLLLDEIEKADTDLLNIFLTILDEGYFTDGLGKRVDCKNLVIIATSNAGSEFIFNSLSNNMNSTPADQQAFTQKLIHYLVDKHTFTPEFLNRFDGVVAYNPLQQNNIIVIAKKFLTPVTQQIESMYKIKVKVSDTTLENLAQKSYDPAFGARDMERILRQDIEDKIAKMIFEGKAKEGDTINL